MIYKFTSKASGDIIMMGPQGDELMHLLKRTPAAQGIIEVADLPKALQALEAALATAATTAATDSVTASRAEETTREAPVALRQRLWPVMEMLRRCQAAGQPVVWGV